MSNFEKKETILDILKKFSGFKKINDKKSYEEAGWKETEGEYQKAQQEWLKNRVKKK